MTTEISCGTKEALREMLRPCISMVLVEGCIIGLTILASTAMAKGMSPYVFVVYTNALGSILLLPFTFFHDRSRNGEPLLTFPLFIRLFVLGFIGVTIAQNLAFVGLSYSSPIVACGMANQMPAFSFLLGLLLRTTKFDCKSSGSRARLIGTLISFSGAVSLTLYKGPTVRNQSSSPSLAFRAAPRLLVFTSTHENWVLGCILFAAASFTLAIWNVVQVGTLKMCSKVMKIISLYSLFGTLQSAALAMFLERDPNAWRLDFNFELLIIILTAVFSSLIRIHVQMWCTRIRGPNFVPIFKPFGIPYASAFGSFFFADTFHYGSMMGALICGVGYYTVLWGQFKDEETSMIDNNYKGKISSMDDDKVPLLQDQESQV
ncbi:WAT1-related protein At1g70260-like [Andrographis paniculata]|uniref:WAT1-related protein At1g70260-like n=1 Tax=Andrographis paniculata TaxID=175694 RepID=UPI0021E8287E|nr:WAT1-related protein At1g70260-like [Andrographis paniculata]XP_051145480.1 WAT1-related protein At1g70260-like [Andrographis paniculata]